MEKVTGRIELDLGDKGRYVSFFSGSKPGDLEKVILDQVKDYFSGLEKRRVKKSNGNSFVRTDTAKSVIPVMTKPRRKRRRK